VIALPALGLTTVVVSWLALAPAARADFIVGQVVDSQGVGVPGVNIDAVSQIGGGTRTLINDGTDANGFFTTTIPAGLFTLTFIPPAPPASSLLTGTMTDVVIVGTTDLAQVPLPDGLLIEGRVLSTGLFPAAGVELELRDENDPGALPLETVTDPFGEFLMVCPPGTFEFRLDPSLVPGQTLAPLAAVHSFTTSVDLGDILLEPGFHITAVMLHPGGQPLVGADSDTEDALTGDSLYTPSDNTDATGFLDIVVPAGLYNFNICPQLSTGLVGVTFTQIPVVQDVHAGTLTVPAGVLMTGLVDDLLGQGISKVDLDLVQSSTGLELGLCGDNTDSSGAYAVNVLPGTWDIRITPPFSEPYGSRFFPGTVIAGPMVLDATLPDCPTHVPYGTGTLGSGGFEPELEASGGSARLGNEDYKFQINDALGGAHAVLIVGLAPTSVPFAGGSLLVSGPKPPGRLDKSTVKTLQLHPLGAGTPYPAGLPLEVHLLKLGGPAGVAGAGQLSLLDPIPQIPALSGISRYAQLMVRDPGVASGWALSHGIQITYLE
jgi:hypothetical protein